MDFAGDVGALQRRVAEVPEGAERRNATFAAMAPRAGDTVVDLGCGGGHLLRDLGRAVAPGGQAIGIDISEDQLAAAATHIGDEPGVALHCAPGDDLPLEDGAADAVGSIQTLDYIDAVAPVLAECRRVLKRGGRLACVSVLWDHWRIHGADPELSDQIHEAWRAHCPHQMLPMEMPALLAEAGFDHVTRRSLMFMNTGLHGNCYAGYAARLASAFAVGQGVAKDDADAWLDQLAKADAEGRFLMVSVPVLTTAWAV